MGTCSGGMGEETILQTEESVRERQKDKARLRRSSQVWMPRDCAGSGTGTGTGKEPVEHQVRMQTVARHRLQEPGIASHIARGAPCTTKARAHQTHVCVCVCFAAQAQSLA